MTQAFAAPVIQQPEKPKKNFCFAAVPFVLIALIVSFELIRSINYIPSNWYEVLDNTDYLYDIISDFLSLFYSAFMLIGAAVMAVLLFVKVYNAWLGVPLFMFSIAFILFSASQVVSLCDLVFGKEIVIDSLSEAIFENFLYLLTPGSAAIAFLIASVYTFIVTARKKPASKMLWLFPAISFVLFYLPWTVISFIWFVEMVYYLEFESLKYFSEYLTYPLLPVAVILLLIWLSFPYKKEKSQKATQPAPQTAPVMPPVIPEVKHAYTPAKHEDADPERTLDYSYAEIFYPPVSKTAVKPEPEKKPSPVSKNDMEHQLNNIQLLTEYKKLLDNGVITQEDYDRKKNELLGF